MPTNTAHYDFNLPLVNSATDQDLWGGYLNSNISAQDSLIFTAMGWITSGKSASFSITAPTTGTSALGESNTLFTCGASGGNIVATLPPAAQCLYMKVGIKKVDASVNTVSFQASGSETIDGQSTYTLTEQFDVCMIVSNGGEWLVINTPAVTVPDASTTVKGIIEIATTAEVQTGSDTSRAIVPSALSGAIGFTKYNSSVASSYSNGAALTIAHGFGVAPVFVVVRFVCQTAEGGYSAGDVIYCTSSFGEVGTRGVTISSNATNINIIVGTAGVEFQNKTTGAVVILTPANWKIASYWWG